MTPRNNGDTASPVLLLERTFDAPPERIFAAWTEPSLLMQWWGPPGSVVKVAEVDLRVGGRYRLGIQFDAQPTYYVTGEYSSIESPHRLVFTWRWENADMDVGVSLVTIELQRKGQKTALRLKHEQLPDEEARRSHTEGWTGILQELQEFLTR